MSDQKEPGRTFSMKLPADMADSLSSTAERAGITKSDLVREAVGQYLASHEEPRAGSFLAAVGDLAGSVEGPEDLSVDPRHLEGFGKS